MSFHVLLQKKIWAIYYKSSTWSKVILCRIPLLNYLLGWPRRFGRYKFPRKIHPRCVSTLPFWPPLETTAVATATVESTPGRKRQLRNHFGNLERNRHFCRWNFKPTGAFSNFLDGWMNFISPSFPPPPPKKGQGFPWIQPVKVWKAFTAWGGDLQPSWKGEESSKSGNDFPL